MTTYIKYILLNTKGAVHGSISRDVYYGWFVWHKCMSQSDPGSQGAKARNTETYHMYLTSDQQPKENDWVVMNGDYLVKYKEGLNQFFECKKIEATTNEAISLPKIKERIKIFIVDKSSHNFPMVIEMDGVDDEGYAIIKDVVFEYPDYYIKRYQEHLLREKEEIQTLLTTNQLPANHIFYT